MLVGGGEVIIPAGESTHLHSVQLEPAGGGEMIMLAGECTHIHNVQPVPVGEGGHSVDTAGGHRGIRSRAHWWGSVEPGQIL